MKKSGWAVLLLMAASFGGAPSWAQGTPAVAQNAGGNGVPRQIANRTDHRDLEPSRTAVHAQEKAAGLRLPATQRQRETDEVERMAAQLERAVPPPGHARPPQP